MRVIKFRAWDDGRMVYHDQRFYDHKQTHVSNLINLSKFFSIIREDAMIMQFTGLLDKNGKEIYEGDIVKTDSGAYAFIEYREDMAAFVCRIKFNSASMNIECAWSVEGNIYESPNLFK